MAMAMQQLSATQSAQPEVLGLYGCIDIAATMHALHVCVTRACKHSQHVLKEAIVSSIKSAGAVPKSMVYAINTYVVLNTISAHMMFVSLSSAD